MTLSTARLTRLPKISLKVSSVASLRGRSPHQLTRVYFPLPAKNIAMQGTMVLSGSGTGIIVQTGDNTVFGRIAKKAGQSKSGMTTLEHEIYRFVLVIASLAFAFATLIVILWAAWIRKDHPGFITVPQLLVRVEAPPELAVAAQCTDISILTDQRSIGR